MPITIKTGPPKPAPAPKEYGIFEALAEFYTREGETLMLVHRFNGDGYKVMHWDPLSKTAKLKGAHGQHLSPKLTDREDKLYVPVWR